MSAFAVPRYLAQTALLDEGVRGWISGLPAIVADLADRWSLAVGEPFQPGGQCSWTAPVTDPAGLTTRMAVLAGMDAGRVRQWLFARSVRESVGSPLMRQVARRLAPA